jgi:hypothetical protein
MTFTPIACATGYINYPGNPYTEAGFTLTSSNASNFATWCADAPSYAGPGMYIDYAGATASLTKNGGGIFSINGIELAHYSAGSYAQSFTFIGNLYGGGTVSQTFTIPYQSGYSSIFHPYTFDPTWTNLSSVTFASQDPNFYQFTNVLLDGTTTVPEPASMALLGTGLVGVFGAVRWRRKQSA